MLDWDPKDGELCLGKLKPEETLVEDCSDSDVQIDRQNRYNPPPEFPLASICPSIVHHLSGTNQASLCSAQLVKQLNV